MIKWITIVFLSIFMGCSSAPATKKEKKVEITVVKHRVPPWITISQLESALRDDKKPDYILLTTMKCNSCRYLHAIMEQMGWTNKVLFVNMEEPWVKKLTEGTNIRILPTLVVTLGGRKSRTVAFSGLESIATALFEQFNTKIGNKRL